MGSIKQKNPKVGRRKFATVQQWIEEKKPSFSEADLATALDEQSPRVADATQLSTSDRVFWDKHAGIHEDAPTIAQASAANAAARMLMDSTALSGAEVAKLLGLAVPTIRDYKARAKLFAYERSGRSMYPTWQFTEYEGDVIPHLQDVLATLPDGIHPQTVMGLFTTPKPGLVMDGKPVSPKDWLRQGGAVQPVVEIARHLHESF